MAMTQCAFWNVLYLLKCEIFPLFDVIVRSLCILRFLKKNVLKISTKNQFDVLQPGKYINPMFPLSPLSPPHTKIINFENMEKLDRVNIISRQKMNWQHLLVYILEIRKYVFMYKPIIKMSLYSNTKWIL